MHHIHIKRKNILLALSAATLIIGTAYISLSALKGSCAYAGDPGDTPLVQQEARNACYENYWFVY